MLGNYTHTIDAKGRLFIPSRIREELGEVFYVTLSDEQCLNAYSLESWKEFEVEVKALSRIERREFRKLFAHACKCELDSQGRILLPKELRDAVGLTKNVTIVGNIDIAEFWDADVWAEKDEEELRTLPDLFKSGLL